MPTGGTGSQWVLHAIRVNSVGYLPNREKIATVVPPAGATIPDGSSAAVYELDGTQVWTCALTGPMTDPDSNATYYLADFTGFTTPGTYYLEIPSLAGKPGPDGGVDPTSQSAPFTIDQKVMAGPLATAMTGMYGQRCGTKVSITLPKGTWGHDACHLEDAYLDYLTGADTIEPSTGGWHDAGDYGKYMTNGAFTVGMLLAAYEHFPNAVSSLTLPIPEHGMTAAGGAMPLPDYLWEVKWEIDWMLSTQQPDGGVPHKETAINFEPFPESPDEDAQKRFFTGVGTSATADFVAVMAQAARIYEPFDPTDAAKYLAAANLSWTYLQANAGPPVPANNSMFNTGGYGDTSDIDNRLWAGAELWETDPTHTDALMKFEAGFAHSPTTSVAVNFDYDNVVNLGIFTYLLSQQTGRDPAIVAGLTTSLLGTADALTATANAGAFGRDLSGYWWGSNGAVARTAMNLWVASQLSPTTPNPGYLDTIAKAVDHLLGRNFYDRTQVTQVGYHPPVYPHHGPSQVKPGNPYPGLLVGGANSTSTMVSPANDVDWTDSAADYDVNEIAINWNGAFIYAVAALHATGMQ